MLRKKLIAGILLVSFFSTSSFADVVTTAPAPLVAAEVPTAASQVVASVPAPAPTATAPVSATPQATTSAPVTPPVHKMTTKKEKEDFIAALPFVVKPFTMPEKEYIPEKGVEVTVLAVKQIVTQQQGKGTNMGITADNHGIAGSGGNLVAGLIGAGIIGIINVASKTKPKQVTYQKILFQENKSHMVDMGTQEVTPAVGLFSPGDKIIFSGSGFIKQAVSPPVAVTPGAS